MSISPTTATVATAFTQQFTAKVDHTDNTSVTWQVEGVTGGSSTTGTISGSGLYTAPTSVPSSSFTITAISQADPSKTAQATVTVALPISVSPSTVSLQAAQTQQFSANVSFSTKTGVTWQVNGVAGGNTSIGTINSSGLYTAPNAPPSPATVNVTAVSTQDTSRSASAAVTITPAPVVIAPTTAVVAAGTQQVFAATVLSATVQPVWSVSCSSTATDACGSIGADGTYTAPITPPRTGVVTISASSGTGDPSTGSATVTIQFGNATLAGRYVFTTTDEIGHTAPSQAGTIVFDGAGHITGGVLDSTDAPGSAASISGGTYTVGTDGRGTAIVQAGAASFNLDFVLSNNQRGFVFRTDTSGNQAAGTLDLQQSLSGSALNGAYTLSLSGITSGQAGVLFGEVGSLATTSTGTVTGGVIDVDKNLAAQTTSVTSGSYTQPSADGRGTLTVTTANGTQSFAFYPIDQTRTKLVATDGASSALGELFAQTAGPFANSTVKGRYAFSVNGVKSGAPNGAVGVFTFNGTGGVTNQQFDGIPQTVFDFTPGLYAVSDAQTRRTTATWTANGGQKLQYVLYPRSDGGFVVLETDGIFAGSGVALPQANLSVGNFLILKGALGLSFGGSELSTPTTPERFTGEIVATTSPTLSGSIDGTTVGQAIAFSLNLLSTDVTAQRYTLGVSSTALTGETIVVYRVDDDRAFMLISDSSRVLTGTLERQY